MDRRAQQRSGKTDQKIDGRNLTAEDAEDAEEEMALEIVDHSSDAVFQVDGIEIDEQSKFLAAEFQIGEQLGFVDGRDLFDRLQFHDHRIFHQQIDSIA